MIAERLLEEFVRGLLEEYGLDDSLRMTEKDLLD